jgi:enoyl-CoA hydratase/carnithine racemase
MTGERISAQEALRINLVQELVDDLSQAIQRAYQLAILSQRVSPTANAMFKQVVLNTTQGTNELKSQYESDAYEHCVSSGQAAIGRASFSDIRQGKAVNWGPKQFKLK